MHIVPIPPKSLFAVSCEYSRFQFALCHEVLADQEYAKLYSDYADLRGTGLGPWVILDNGAFELGTSDIDTNLVAAIKTIEPQEVVLPDRMFMADTTVYMSKVFRKRHGKLLENRSVAGVAHGRNHDEFLQCAVDLVKDVGVDVIMIPKDYEAWSGGRRVLVAMLQCLKKPIHLLGMEQDCGAFLKYESADYVRSMDTVKPFSRAMSGLSMFAERVDVARPYDYFNRVLSDAEVDQVIANLKEWKEAAHAWSMR